MGSLEPKENCTFVATHIGPAYSEGGRWKDAEALRVVEINPISRRPPEWISQLVTDIRKFSPLLEKCQIMNEKDKEKSLPLVKEPHWHFTCRAHDVKKCEKAEWFRVELE
ncbi:hypothetical protein B0H14DRAFT_2585443 [Mycena olivaceomarginata]|nr:hypothetical protein B0H14DRAFT_2585443 [Mycena olivaceomarginata]